MGCISEVLFGENPCHMETIQFIYIASQLSRKKTILQVNCLRIDNSMRFISEFVYLLVYLYMNK